MRLFSLGPAALLSATFTLGATSMASAQYQQAPPVYQQQPPVYQQAPPPGYHQGRYQIHDIRWVKSRVGTAVATLSKDRREYGGHRVAALQLLRYANEELRMSIGWAIDHGYQFNDLGVQHSGERAFREAPDRPVYNAQRHAQNWIDMLQRDGRDYGGHRAAAIQNLQRAEAELTAALQTGE